MRELIAVWRNTRMIVLVGVTAALYVAVLLPFKGFQIVPGFAEFRPAAAVPIVCSMLFGPAGAWGAAFGNLVGDLLGAMFGLGSVFGFAGNLLLGYVPYRLWHAFTDHRPTMRRPRHYAIFGLCVVAASLACGTVIGWGVHLLGFVPFTYLANYIAVQNVIAGALLGPPLLLATHRRLERMGLVYEDILADSDRTRARWPLLSAVFVIAVAVAAIVLGNVLCMYGHDLEFFKFVEGVADAGAFGWQMLPVVLFMLLWIALL